MDITVFHSHIEVSPYKEGDIPELEKMFSKYDSVRHKRIVIAYFILNNVLYLPRGTNLMKLQELIQSTPLPFTKPDDYSKFESADIVYNPKNDLQEKSINFLLGKEESSYTGRYSQLGLNLSTGDGKTYCTIASIIKYKIKSIVITHQDKIKNQWIDSVLNMTTINKDRVCNIHGTEIIEKIMNDEIEADIYFVNHQTIASYARSHSWYDVREFFKKIKVGIKVFDEAHKFFSNIFMIDCFSNCYKTFYLTATFGRSDPLEVSIYKRAFSYLVRFGEDSIEVKRKHTKFIVCLFSSKPEYGVIPDVRNKYGFSNYKYIDYEFSDISGNRLVKVLLYILKSTRNIEGKTLIISPKKETVDLVAKLAEDNFNNSVGTIYSDNKDTVNEENKNKEIISSTIKSIGEGSDIKKLRILINLEPISSKIIADQVQGRLREYSETDETYLFYPVDISVPECMISLKKMIPTMKKKCKDITYMNIDNFI